LARNRCEGGDFREKKEGAEIKVGGMHRELRWEGFEETVFRGNGLVLDEQDFTVVVGAGEKPGGGDRGKDRACK